METHTLHIRNMVCDRCIRTVTRTLHDLGWEVVGVELGIARIQGISKNDAHLSKC